MNNGNHLFSTNINYQAWDDNNSKTINNLLHQINNISPQIIKPIPSQLDLANILYQSMCDRPASQMERLHDKVMPHLYSNGANFNIQHPQFKNPTRPMMISNPISHNRMVSPNIHQIDIGNNGVYYQFTDTKVSTPNINNQHPSDSRSNHSPNLPSNFISPIRPLNHDSRINSPQRTNIQSIFPDSSLLQNINYLHAMSDLKDNISHRFQYLRSPNFSPTSLSNEESQKLSHQGRITKAINSGSIIANQLNKGRSRPVKSTQRPKSLSELMEDSKTVVDYNPGEKKHQLPISENSSDDFGSLASIRSENASISSYNFYKRISAKAIKQSEEIETSSILRSSLSLSPILYKNDSQPSIQKSKSPALNSNLPLKKRIVWHVDTDTAERTVEDVYKEVPSTDSGCKKTVPMMNQSPKLLNNPIANHFSLTNKSKDLSMDSVSQPNKRKLFDSRSIFCGIPKKFLPMEHKPNTEDTDSDEDVVITKCHNPNEKNDNYYLNNI